MARYLKPLSVVAHAARSITPTAVARQCQSSLKPALLSHGGPVLGGKPIVPGTGNCLTPANTAAVRKRPTLQIGHKRTSILATRAMNACAESSACALRAGICKASRAALSCLALQPEASSP